MAKYNLENLQISEVNTKGLYEDMKKTEDRLLDISVALLDDYPNNKFSQIQGEAWEEFLQSIKENGILTPITVRKKADGRYEILSGHNRKRAAIEAGINIIPAVVKNCDDVEASAIVGVSNNQRPDITDIEWGEMYRVTYEILKKTQGRKSSQARNFSEDEKLSQTGTIKRTDEIVAEKYGVSKNTLLRKMRLSYLVNPLKSLYLGKHINQEQAEQLSYLKEKEQFFVANSISQSNCKMTIELAKELKAISKDFDKQGKELTVDEIFKITKNIKEKIKKTSRKYELDDMYFPEDFNKKEKMDYLIAALKFYKEHNKICGLRKDNP